MRLAKIPLAPLLAVFLAAESVSARTWHVELDGSGDAMEVQRGIALAVSGDTVLVGPGTYYEDIDFLGKGIVLKSLMGPEATILDGTGQDSSVVIFRSGETRSAVLEGFTITNGRGTPFPLLASQRNGGGIICLRGSPSIRRNRITGNEAAWGGGAWAGKVSDDFQPWDLPEPLFEENSFEHNLVDRGGGGLNIASSRSTVIGNVFVGNVITLEGDGGGLRIDLRRGQARVQVAGNEFWGNIASDQGGGLYAYMTLDADRVDIEHNLFVRNEAHGVGPSDIGTGGGIAVEQVAGSIQNNTLVGNVGWPTTSCTGGGIRLFQSLTELLLANNLIAFNSGCGIVCRGIGTATFGRNLLWANEGGELSLCSASWMSLVVHADPQFCGAERGDFHVAVSSPALNGPSILGAFGEPGCGPVAVESTTWGRLKALYR